MNTLDERKLATACRAVSTAGYPAQLSETLRVAITAYLAAAPAPVVKVKPLEWRKRHESEFLSRAETVVGTYRVWSHHEARGVWYWELSDLTGGRVLDGPAIDEADAKAAARADYERRILSALEPDHA